MRERGAHGVTPRDGLSVSGGDRSGGETSPIPFDPSDDQPPRRWRKRLRRIGRWTAIGLGSLVVLALLALTFLQTRWGNELVRARVEKALAGKLDGGSVSLGSIDHSFLFGEIDLGDLTIRDRSGTPAVSLGSLHATLDRSSLLSREAVIGELSLDDLAVHIVKNVDGTSNLTGLFKKSKGSSLKRIAVGSLSVAGASATIDKPDGSRIAVDGLVLTGSVDAVPGAAVDLALQRIAAAVTIARPDAEPRALEVGVGSVTLVKRTAGTDLAVKEVMAGPLALSSLAVHAALVDGEPRGQQSVEVSGLTVRSSELHRLIGKKLLAGDVAVEATMAGPPDDLRITGQVATGGGTLALTGSLALGERLRYQMSLVGSDIDSQKLLASARLPVESSLKIDLSGEGRTADQMTGRLTASVGPSRAGKVAIDGIELAASWDHGAVSLEKLSARALGVEVTAGGALDAARTVDGTVRVRGNPAAAAAELGLALPIRALPRQLDVTVSARGALRGEIAVALEPTRVQLAGGALAVSGHATLTDRTLSAASARVRLTDLDLAALARLAGRPPKVTGSLTGSIDLERAGAHTDVAYDLTALLDRPALAVRLRGAADPRSAVALELAATRRSDGAVLATADARLPIATRGGKRTLARDGDWHLVVDVGERSLAEVAALLPERLRGKIPAGAVAAHIDIGGTPAQPSGSAHIDLTGAFLKGRPLEQEVRLDATIRPRSGGGLDIATDGSLKIDGRQDPTALIRGGVTLPALDRAALRRATLDLAVEIPRRPLASLAGLRPALARLPGQVGGGATLRGPIGAIQIDSRLAWNGYRTADGGAGETALVVRGTPRDLAATATMSGGVSIAADIHRKGGGSIAIATKARANGVPLARVLPEWVARRVDQPGRLDWRMDGAFALARVDGKLKAIEKSLAGTLQVDDAVVALPGSGRRWERIGIDVEAGEDGLTIRSLALHERDVEVADRSVEIRGAVAWNQLKPTRVALDLRGRDWLLFGTPLLGRADAPRAAADLDVGLAIDLTRPIMKVDATVRHLDLRSPDRAERGHQPEQIAPNGDLIFVDGKTVVGKLPVTPPPLAAAQPRRRRPMDITVRIPRLVRINQTPFDLRARGSLQIAVREAGTRVRGGLAIPKGSLYLFGKHHRLVDGKLSFSDQHPKGWIELVFRRKLSPADSRALAGMDEMEITFAGPPTAPKPKLGGAGNVALAEAMAMNASGHPLHLSEPDMPASATVQAPRGDQLQVLSFMASNMPHLLFLDRFAAWADPTDGRAAYGRVQHFEGERTSASGRSRVRVVTRPPTPGRSSAEIHWDRLLMDRRRAAFGVGLRGGSRAGGGVGFFFEWSSDD